MEKNEIQNDNNFIYLFKFYQNSNFIQEEAKREFDVDELCLPEEEENE